MVCTSLGHFLQLPHMDKACDDWKTEFPPDVPATLTEFKQFFTRKFFNYQNHQASLSDASVANSATIITIHAKLASLHATYQHKDEQLSLLMEHLQQSVTSPPAVSNTASIKSNLTNPTISPLVSDMGIMIQQ